MSFGKESLYLSSICCHTKVVPRNGYGAVRSLQGTCKESDVATRSKCPYRVLLTPGREEAEGFLGSRHRYPSSPARAEAVVKRDTRGGQSASSLGESGAPGTFGGSGDIDSAVRCCGVFRYGADSPCSRRPPAEGPGPCRKWERRGSGVGLHEETLGPHVSDRRV